MDLTAMNKILLVAGNSSNEALGCSRIIALHTYSRDPVQVFIFAECSTPRQQERERAQTPEELLALLQAPQTVGTNLGSAGVELLAFTDNSLDSLNHLDLIKRNKECVERHHPECYYVHNTGDLNVDHHERLERRHCAQSRVKSPEAFCMLRQLV